MCVVRRYMYSIHIIVFYEHYIHQDYYGRNKTLLALARYDLDYNSVI